MEKSNYNSQRRKKWGYFLEHNFIEENTIKLRNMDDQDNQD